MLNTRLDRIKAAREAEEAKQNELRAAQQEARADIPALNVEKKELWEVRSVELQGQGWLVVERASAHRECESVVRGDVASGYRCPGQVVIQQVQGQPRTHSLAA